MGTPFLGEIRPMSFNFPPRGWAQCNGQLLPINQNQPLFSLLGTTYGGDGRTTFALPNLRGRVPVGSGAGKNLGESAGSETVALTPSQIPQHIHTLSAMRTAATTGSPGIFASSANIYGAAANLTPIGSTTNPPTIRAAGSQPHANMMPFSVLNFCIALQGVFPSQN
jgi:microcystin-dependent protein